MWINDQQNGQRKKITRYGCMNSSLDNNRYQMARMDTTGRTLNKVTSEYKMILLCTYYFHVKFDQTEFYDRIRSLK